MATAGSEGDEVPRDDETDLATTVFVRHRNLLFTVAYEILGSASDAEDVLPETWLRWVGVRAIDRSGDQPSCQV